MLRVISSSRPESVGAGMRRPMPHLVVQDRGSAAGWIATGTPSSPTTIRLIRQPIATISTAMTGGAAAKPKLPLNVCSAKERPMRSLSTEPARIA